MALIFATWVLLSLPLPSDPHAGGDAASATNAQVKPAGCATNNGVLDVLAHQTRPDQLIIIIARLGTGERDRGLNRRRLHNVKTYLTEYVTGEGGRRGADMLILAEGERVKGYGRVEFYVGGVLTTYILVGRGSDLIIGTCYPEPGENVCALPTDRNFYPCLDRAPQHGKRRGPRDRE